MITEALKTAKAFKRGMQVFIMHDDDAHPGSLNSRGLMVDVRKVDSSGFDLWVMNGRTEGRYDFESGEVKCANRKQTTLKGGCFEVLSVSRDEYDYWRMENSLRDNPDSVIIENDIGLTDQSEMVRLEAGIRTTVLRNLQRWTNPIYRDGTDRALENLTGFVRNGVKIDWNTPSRINLAPIAGNAYRADFDWVSTEEKPKGIGNTRIDAIIDLYQDAMSKLGWSAAHVEELRKIKVDDCDPKIQKEHLRFMEFVAELMNPDHLDADTSRTDNESLGGDIPEESGPTP